MSILKTMGLVMLVGMFAFPAYADNKHGVRVKVINHTDPTSQIEVQTANGKDNFPGLTPHKVYYISHGGERWVKAHGQGKNKIFIQVKKLGQDRICKDAGLARLTWGRHSDGDVIEVSTCHEGL